MRLPCRTLAGKFCRLGDVGYRADRIVVGLLHPIDPFRLSQDELAYIKSFYHATDYLYELTYDVPFVKNRSMYAGFIVLTKP